MTLDCILLTGAGGKVARQIRPHLARMCRQLRLTDRVPVDLIAPNETAYLAELADPGAWPELGHGAQAIVHFAGYPREADWQTLFEPNILAVTNLWEAAQAARVSRIVYASSNHAVGYYARDQVIDHAAPPRPDSRYGVTKVFMEALAAMHADKHGIQAMGLRIGYCATEPVEARMLSHWVHPDDLAALIQVGLTADYRHEIVYGVSANATRRYLQGIPTLATATGSQLGASLFLVLPAIWLWPDRMPSLQAWLAVLALGTACTGLAYILFFRLIATAGPARALTVTFLVPVFALFYGAVLLGEEITHWMLICAAVIVCGVAMSSGLIKLGRRAATTPSPLPPR